MIRRSPLANLTRVASLLERIAPVAEACGISFGQLAPAWAIHQPGCTHVLAGARNEEQIRENAAAGDVELSEADLQAIAAAIEIEFPPESDIR